MYLARFGHFISLPFQTFDHYAQASENSQLERKRREKLHSHPDISAEDVGPARQLNPSVNSNSVLRKLLQTIIQS